VPSNKENNNTKKSIGAHEVSGMSSSSGTTSANMNHHYQTNSGTGGYPNLGTRNKIDHMGPGSHPLNMAKMSLKGREFTGGSRDLPHREFGKELTNANSTTENYNVGGATVLSSAGGPGGLFASTNSIHPQTVKNSDHSHNHPHTSNILGVSVTSNGSFPTKKGLNDVEKVARAGSSGIPEHLMLN
jgi:hypothetical protein